MDCCLLQCAAAVLILFTNLLTIVRYVCIKTYSSILFTYLQSHERYLDISPLIQRQWNEGHEKYAFPSVYHYLNSDGSPFIVVADDDTVDRAADIIQRDSINHDNGCGGGGGKSSETDGPGNADDNSRRLALRIVEASEELNGDDVVNSVSPTPSLVIRSNSHNDHNNNNNDLADANNDASNGRLGINEIASGIGTVKVEADDNQGDSKTEKAIEIVKAVQSNRVRYDQERRDDGTEIIKRRDDCPVSPEIVDNMREEESITLHTEPKKNNYDETELEIGHRTDKEEMVSGDGPTTESSDKDDGKAYVEGNANCVIATGAFTTMPEPIKPNGQSDDDVDVTELGAVKNWDALIHRKQYDPILALDDYLTATSSSIDDSSIAGFSEEEENDDDDAEELERDLTSSQLDSDNRLSFIIEAYSDSEGDLERVSVCGIGRDYFD